MALKASDIKALRDQTGAGMMDCKKALTESDGDMEKAIEWLRVKGLSKAAKKSGRAAAEGLVACQSEGSAGVLIEVNAETDFVAKNETFQTFVKELLPLVQHDAAHIEGLGAATYKDGKTVSEQLMHLISVIGENMVLRRVASLQVTPGVVCSYIHNAVSPELGRIGVLVALQSSADPDKLRELGDLIAMHIAAARPIVLTREQLDPELVEKEREVFRQNALESGKPEAAIEKMVEGRINKYFQEVVLLEQIYVLDGKTKVKDMLEQAGKDFGIPVELVGFERFELGEGIEKETGDFASEVSGLIS
jgi:elongation factor Ts